MSKYIILFLIYLFFHHHIDLRAENFGKGKDIIFMKLCYPKILNAYYIKSGNIVWLHAQSRSLYSTRILHKNGPYLWRFWKMFTHLHAYTHIFISLRKLKLWKIIKCKGQVPRGSLSLEDIIPLISLVNVCIRTKPVFFCSYYW